MGFGRFTAALFLILSMSAVSYADTSHRRLRPQSDEVSMQLRDAVGEVVEKGTIGGDERGKGKVGTVCIDSAGRRHYWTRKSQSEKMNYRRCLNEVMELLEDDYFSDDDSDILN